MLEISPVLAGTFDAPDYSPPNNFAAGRANDPSATAGTNAIDSRRYTQFDHSATEAGSTTDFSFDDFLDMINPLQHIPVVSSVYREITGEKIHPVARIVGDIFYGGLLGGATAALSGAGAIGDSVMEATNGKDATGIVVSALFGPDSPTSPDATTQLADATPATPSSTPAIASAVASATTPSPATPSAPPAIAPLAALPQLANLAPPPAPANADAETKALIASRAFALDPKKLPFGGVMDPGALQGSNMALALAASAPGVQMNNMVYPGRLGGGVKPSAVAATPAVPSSSNQASNAPVAAPASAQAAAAPGASPANPQASNTPIFLPPGTAQNSPLPPELMQDIASLRAINQYRNAASHVPPAGASVDVVN